jgi:hypothetical protein
MDKQPWINNSTYKLIQKQHTMHEKMKRNPTPENKKKHNQIRNLLKKELQISKKLYYTTEINNTKHNQKLQSQILKTLLPSKKQQHPTPTSIIYKQTTYTKPKDIADKLNDHFITIGHKTSQTIPPTSPTPTSPPPPPPPPTPPPSPLPPPFALKQTTIDIVTNILHNLNPNKASDIYDIKPIILKSLTPTLAPILTSLYNESIEQHHYPDALKITKLIILFKSKEHNLPENYRPISLLPIIGKILDKIINDQIMTHCIKHNILSPTQYAFRPNSNTSLALQTILDKLQQHISNKQPTLAIYLDLSKAYDTVSHQKLLFKLQHIFNFDPHTISFLTSYFTNRTQHYTQTTQHQIHNSSHTVYHKEALYQQLFLFCISTTLLPQPNIQTFTPTSTTPPSSSPHAHKHY